MMTGVVSAEQAVLEANHCFYQVLSELDTEAMEQIWLHEPWVRCVHRGRQMLCGWDNVIESWRQSFSHTESHQRDKQHGPPRLGFHG